MKYGRALFLSTIVIFIAFASRLRAQQTTAFTYQGQLHDSGTNANGIYTMIFALYDSSISGNQIGSNLTVSPTLANGLFSVNLDFGAGAFNGSARWLNITVSNGPDMQELSPRVQVLPSPYALYSATAGIADALIPNAVTTADIRNGAVTPDKLSTDPAALTTITGNSAFITNTTVDEVTNLTTFAVNGFVQSMFGGFIFPDGTVQTTATPMHGITNFDASTNVDAPLSNLFTVPAGVTQLYVEAWGGGGGGGGNGIDFDTGQYVEGGVGGGGGYARGFVAVSPLVTYKIVVGNGGKGGNAGTAPGDSGTAGMDAGDTYIEFGPNTVLFKCQGGGGGGGGMGDGTPATNGTGGGADPTAGIQQPGITSAGPLGTLQPNQFQASFGLYDQGNNGALLTYGSPGYDLGGVSVYGIGGCIIIQW